MIYNLEPLIYKDSDSGMEKLTSEKLHKMKAWTQRWKIMRER